MHAPHLPSAPSTIAWYKAPSLPWILLMVILSIAAGFAASFATAAWITPPATSQDLSSVLLSRSGGGVFASPQPKLARDMESKLVTIFDTTKQTENGFYAASAKIGEAVMISSDGWAVVFAPTYTSGKETQWEAMNHLGNRFEITAAVADPFSSFVALKLSTSASVFASFPNWDTLTRGTLLWARKASGFDAVAVDGVVHEKMNETHALAEPLVHLGTSTPLPSGTLVFSETGAFVGAVNVSGTITEAFYLEQNRTQIFSEKKFLYKSVPWDGFFVKGSVERDGVVLPLVGWQVSNLHAYSAKGRVRVGDVIARVNGELIDPLTLSRTVLQADSPLTLTLIRDGKELLATVDTVPVP